MLERREVSPATSTYFASTSCKHKEIGIKGNCFFLRGFNIYNYVYYNIYKIIYIYIIICPFAFQKRIQTKQIDFKHMFEKLCGTSMVAPARSTQ